MDERASAVLVQITANSPALQELAFGGFGDLLGDQQMIMRLEPQRGLDVMPDMLSDADDADMDARAMALRARNRIATVGGPLPKDGQARLASPGAAPEKRALIALRRKMEPEVSTRRP